MPDVPTLTDEAVQAVYTYANAIDTRDWERLRALLCDTVHIDYGSNGSVDRLMPSADWIERLHVLYGFDATLHVVTNPTVKLDGDKAVCTSYVTAYHFVKHAGEEHGAYACGTYIHELVRDGGCWRAAKVTFLLAGRINGEVPYARAFEVAAELAPSRSP